MENDDYRKDHILGETLAAIRSTLGREIDGLTVARAVVGLFFSGVKLSNGDAGLCFTPIKDIPDAVCCPSSAAAIPGSGKMTGRPVTYFLEGMEADKPLKRALGIAVINALSATCWKRQPPQDYTIEFGLDPLDNAHIPDEALVVVVGALVPYIKMLMQRGKPFCILEKDARTLKQKELPFFVPPNEAMAKVAQADWLIITGTTLINDTLEDILRHARSDAEIVVVGPTASMLPEAFFRRGVKTLGGTMVTAADKLLDTLVEAGSGYHFYGKSAERIVIKRQ